MKKASPKGPIILSVEYLNTGDTVSIYVYQLTGSNVNMSVSNVAQFSICKLL
jgi:hypothetical protein